MRRRWGRLLGLVCVLVVGSVLPLAQPMAAARDRGGPLIGAARGDELHVMSFNLRFASERGPHTWSQRRPIMAALLRLEQPTLLGTQEGFYGQLRDIAEDLPDRYDWIGEGRKGGSRDEFVAIFFDTDRLEPVAYDHFWLSDTPDVVGSNTWGNDSVRMVTWVRFHDKRTGREFIALNTHLDDESAYSRTRAAELIRDRIGAFPADLPIIVTGDFNDAAENSAPYDILTTGTGLTESWRAARHRLTPAYGSWHHYVPLRVNGRRIDWVLTRGKVTVDAVGLNTFSRKGEFPSDHLPLQVRLHLD
ncbi:MAG TPA: endonuclease/exonuclease/phosphatase family protein [Actinophytocola sp.]|jgi:endonuclease/exonuclease/phosphatase family metal-dependent hydrolase|uniref:endonuclease/exonuclease/phosphatase family protein n=1 Tax=Actinophytocola sp. TaxID=1872138 RepID=UPI002F946C38